MSGVGWPSRVAPVALCAALAGALLIADPHVRDLSAHVFRVELFEEEGFAIWNSSWFGGHYMLTYSVLFPPLAAVLSPQLVGALSAVASAHFFASLVRERWGGRAVWASLWFAVCAAAIFANGNLTFGLGVAFGLGSLLALQRRQPWIAGLAALACALSSPVAAAFLAGAAVVVAIVDPLRRNTAVALAAVALTPVLVLNLLFPETSEQPFAFNSWIAVPVWCAGALIAIRGLDGERGLRLGLIGYVLAVTVVWALPNPLGDNVLRLAAFFGGPLLLAALLAHPAVRRDTIALVAAAAALAWSVYWPLADPVDELADAAGDPSTQAAYYAPLEDWLRAHGAQTERIEVPVTENYWESAYLAPEFSLARGWLRQLDGERDELFFKEHLDPGAYRDWLHDNGVRYVALADAEPHVYGDDERDLILSGPSFLEPRWSSEHWQVLEVRDRLPLVRSLDGGRAQLVSLEPQSFTLQVRRPGSFEVLIRRSPYWSLSAGEGCIGEGDTWTVVRADAPGALRAQIDFSAGAAWRALRGAERSC